MVFVIFTIMVVGILGSLLLLYTAYALRNAIGVTPAARAYTAAETGLEIAHARLASNDPELTDLGTGQSYQMPATTLWGEKGAYQVTVTRNPDAGDGDPYDWLIASRGTYTESVDGVPRTFYRTLEEVISFAAGRYYSALDCVLFSKEGNIDIDLAGDLSTGSFKVAGILVEGNIYAGGNVILANAARFVSGSTLQIKGDIVTEKGDIIVREHNVALAASSVKMAGNLYSGILAKSGDVGGGVFLENRMSVLNGGSIELTGEVNSHGRLGNYDQGVRIINDVGIAGSCTTHITGSVKSRQNVYGLNDVGAAGSPTIDIDGSVHCDKNVHLESNLDFLAAGMTVSVGGSIFAGGNVELKGEGVAIGSLLSEVGGGIFAGGNVDVSTRMWAGATGSCGYRIAGDVYGRNITLTSYTGDPDDETGGGGSMPCSVGGNVYARGTASLLNYARTIWVVVPFAAQNDVTVGGSVYSGGNLTVDTRADGRLFTGSKARVYVNGGVAGLDPPGNGLFSGGSMLLKTGENISSDEALISVNSNSKQSTGTPTINTSGGGTVDPGSTSPACGTFTVPAATGPDEPDPYNEVLMPECDFDYYREMAKGQFAEDGDTRHYVQAGTGEYTLNLDIPMASSLYVVFCEGNLYIESVDLPASCRAVMVATGNVRMKEVSRDDSSAPAEFQVIAGEKFRYDADANLALDDQDQFFLYAAHKSYDATSDHVSVEYEMGWFKDLYGQITARGDIVLKSTGSRFGWLPVAQYSIHYKSPAVLGEAFRIPFKVKYWKEK